ESGEDYPYISVNYSYYLPDGVYAIMSEATRHWITVESDSKYAGSNIQHEHADDSPADSSVFDRSSLFKITRKSGNNYIIRSMLNNNLSFKVWGGTIITTEIPSDDADVLLSETFVIESNGEAGLVIKPYDSSCCIHMSTSSSDLTIINETNATKHSRWSFVQYTGNHKTGMWMTMPASWGNVGIVVGNSGNASAYGWSTRINANTMSLEIKSGYERMGSFTSQTSSCKKTFTATNPGEIAFSIIVKYANGTSVGSSTYTRNIVPQQGTYFIQNVETEKYADVEGPSKAEGAIIQQWAFSAANQKKWGIEHVSGSGGYVRIKSVYSGLYVGVDSSSTTTVRQYSTKNDYTLWKVQLTSSDNLKLTNKATGTVLSSPSSSSNGANLTMVTYTNNSAYKDEWRIVSKVISYVNYYDSTFASNTQLRQNIELANSFSNLAYSKYYSVGMYMDNAAHQYATTIDNCSNGANMPCSDITCGSDCSSNHHKNTFAISSQLYNAPREADHIYILWTHHTSNTYCDEYSGVHTPTSSIALVWDSRPVIHFLKISGGSADVRLACMAITLVHETAHTLKMNDVYDNSGHDVASATDCVMERFDGATAYAFYQDVLNGIETPFCSSCDAAMKSYTSNITISGN
ncbi:MAG: RICIN domain-containing protein, partial [Muribaculaceae bacterium]|nr:RICIN domain-containing protein [Muribaculaceae bacterium]